MIGYKEALKKQNFLIVKGLSLSLNTAMRMAYQLAERVIASKATAAFVTGDELAAGLLNGLSDKGVNIPEDFEIITSDDSQVARFTPSEFDDNWATFVRS